MIINHPTRTITIVQSGGQETNIKKYGITKFQYPKEFVCLLDIDVWNLFGYCFLVIGACKSLPVSLLLGTRGNIKRRCLFNGNAFLPSARNYHFSC